MSEVKRKKVKVEIDVVELKIQLDLAFFENMEKAKKQVADARGYDVSYGEYIQEAMEDLVKMVEDYSNKLIQASDIIKEQDNALGNPSPEEYEKIKEKKEEEPKEEEPVPEELYAHLAENYDNDPMVG